MMKKICIFLVILLFVGCAAFFIIGQLSATETMQNAAQNVLYLELYDRKGNQLGTGSGFLVDETTLITNYHVIESVYSITAKTSDGKEIAKIDTVLCYNEMRDLAALEFPKQNGVQAIALADSGKVKQGDEVYAVGYPLGISNTLSNGIVSSIYKDGRYDYIQFSAPISAGSSGGTLLNNKGQVIGVTSASYISGQNMNLAVPSNDIQALLKYPEPTLLSSLYDKTLTGQAALVECEKVDYFELCDNHERYDGKLVSFIGVVIDVDVGENTYTFAVAPNSTYLDINNRNNIATAYHDYPYVIICETGEKRHTTFENGQKPAKGDYVLVCGYPHFMSLMNNILIQDVRYVSGI